MAGRLALLWIPVALGALVFIITSIVDMTRRTRRPSSVPVWRHALFIVVMMVLLGGAVGVGIYNYLLVI